MREKENEKQATTFVIYLIVMFVQKRIEILKKYIHKGKNENLIFSIEKCSQVFIMHWMPRTKLFSLEKKIKF